MDFPRYENIIWFIMCRPAGTFELDRTGLTQRGKIKLHVAIRIKYIVWLTAEKC